MNSYTFTCVNPVRELRCGSRQFHVIPRSRALQGTGVLADWIDGDVLGAPESLADRALDQWESLAVYTTATATCFVSDARLVRTPVRTGWACGRCTPSSHMSCSFGSRAHLARVALSATFPP